MKYFKMNKMITTGLIVAQIGFAGAALAQDKTGSNAMAGAEGQQGPVAQLAMAQDLYAYGVENKDAVAVLSAAKITSSIGTKDVEREVKTQDIEGVVVPEDVAGVDTPVDAEMMYAAAKELAADDASLVGLIEDAEAEGARGRIGGATRTLSRLRAGKTDIFVVPFFGGSLAELAIIGDGDADLDLVVQDENGNTICIDRSYSDKLYCSWTPSWNGNFVVGVKNMGRIRNSYYILTN